MTREYIQKTIRYLDDLEPGKAVDISRSKTRDDFVQVAKWYIDTWGGLEFNSNYGRIRKCMTKK